jgi:hypothetical protein
VSAPAGLDVATTKPTMLTDPANAKAAMVTLDTTLNERREVGSVGVVFIADRLRLDETRHSLDLRA